MAKTYKFGRGTWATKEGSTLAYNDENENYKPLPFSFERDSIATRVNKEGLIEVVGRDIPRIDYTDSTEGVLLLENSSTNLITYSEDFSQSAWIKGGDISIESGFLAPDGSNNAYKVSGTNAAMQMNTVTSTSASRTIYAKTTSGTGKAHLCSFNGNTNNLFTITENWQRFEVNSATGTSSNNFYAVDFRGSTSLNEILLWGAQSETNSFSTSYIPTSGSTVQRAAETANGSGNSEVFNDSEGVLFANIADFYDSATSRVLSISDGTLNNRVFFKFYTVSNGIEATLVSSSGGTNPQITVTTSDTSNYNKIALKYSVSGFGLWVNGFELGSDTVTNIPNNLSNISFDTASLNDLYGKTKELGYYDTALTDAELETLTSYRSLSELVTELNLNTL